MAINGKKIEPHGGKLINRVMSSSEKNKILDQIEEFKKIQISHESWKVVKNISFGVFSPLKGFMIENESLSVLDNMRLENDIPWPFPIVLDITHTDARTIRVGDSVILTSESGQPISLLRVNDIYEYDKKSFAEKVFGTLDRSHPGVDKIFKQEDFLIGGDIFLIDELPATFPELDLKPSETRKIFKERNWNKIVAFQTRNPPHKGHEYVQKTALTLADGLFINPVIGTKKTGDFLDEVIIRSYQALIEEYYPKHRVLLGTFETEMRYAGPKEAIFHAIARKNFGCNFIIIGRDHAGVRNFYAPYDAHKIFDDFPDLGIEPIFFRSFMLCRVCEDIVNDKICPHLPDCHTNFSGSNIRKMLCAGQEPPKEVMRPEVAKVIFEYQDPFCK
ncbi:MAG TPA: sulfate adenylyltransferase [archaeon]|nr:sulfate adenylyltransferase [archaeon]